MKVSLNAMQGVPRAAHTKSIVQMISKADAQQGLRKVRTSMFDFDLAWNQLSRRRQRARLRYDRTVRAPPSQSAQLATQDPWKLVIPNQRVVFSQ